jgi:hypothetical protein
MCLAHAVKNTTETAYWRSEMFTKRRKLIEAWADYCNAPPATSTDVGGNVVQLRKAG